jgi:hypothetical protein
MDSPVFKALYTHGVFAAAVSVATNPAITAMINNALGAWAPLANLAIVALTAHAGATALASQVAAGDPVAVMASDAAKVAVAALPTVPK